MDEAALFTALREHWFAGAALDAWYQYPPDGGSVLHGSRLPFHELDNVVVTPHFSAWTEPMVRRRYREIAANLDRLSRGGDMSLNLAMMPGDVVNVPKAGVVYVQGSVKKPGAYRLRETMTITQAIGAAGGPDDKLAKRDAVRLFRRGKQGERIEIPVDMARDDVQLVENDIVVVPMSMPRYVVDRFIGGVGMGLSVPLF